MLIIKKSSSSLDNWNKSTNQPQTQLMGITIIGLFDTWMPWKIKFIHFGYLVLVNNINAVVTCNPQHLWHVMYLIELLAISEWNFYFNGHLDFQIFQSFMTCKTIKLFSVLNFMKATLNIFLKCNLLVLVLNSVWAGPFLIVKIFLYSKAYFLLNKYYLY